MRAIQCEMCGSSDIVKDGDFYVCQHCGTKYTVEAAKKLIVEGTVKIDTSDSIQKWIVVARRAIKGKDYITAARYYDMVMAEDPNNWEAVFYSMYCSSMIIKNEEIQYMAQRMSASIRGITKLVFSINDIELRNSAIIELSSNTIVVAQTLSSYSDNYYQELPDEVKDPSKYYETKYICCTILINLADALYVHVNENHICKQKAVEVYKSGFEIAPPRIKSEIYNEKIVYNNIYKEHKKEIDFLRARVQIVKQMDHSFVETIKARSTQNKTSGCYVATCVYGSYDCPQVWTLRRYRDDSLGSTWYGRAFIRIYYAISPMLVKWFGETKWFKKMWQGKLDRMVRKLNAEGVENTPYVDKQW